MKRMIRKDPYDKILITTGKDKSVEMKTLL